MIKNIIKIINSSKFNNILYLLLVTPSLYLLQFDWKKFKIIALFLSVFILLKDFLYLKFKNEKKQLSWIYIILNFLKTLLNSLFLYFQYKSKFLINFNVWISGYIYFQYIINFLKKKYFEKNIINKIVKVNK